MLETSSSDIPLLRGPVPLSHLMLHRFVRPGDSVVDATCGNGNDTLLLARLTGPSGRVWAFDIQDDAIGKTAEVLAGSGLLDRVSIIKAGHETMRGHIAEQVTAVVFNLGYLPGGDRSMITRPDSTLAAVRQALDILAPGGIVAITLYPGHAGGRLECSLLEEWAAHLVPGHFHVWRMGQLNVAPDAPCFVLIQKAS